MAEKNIKPGFITKEMDEKLEKQGISSNSPMTKMSLVKEYLKNRNLDDFIPFQEQKEFENKRVEINEMMISKTENALSELLKKCNKFNRHVEYLYDNYGQEVL